LNTLRNRMVSAGLAFVVVATASAPAYAQPTPATPPVIPAKPAAGATAATAPAPKPAQAPMKAPAPPPAPGPAAAAKPADPKALTKSGDTKLKAGDFAGALADYEAADAAKPTAELAFAIGECNEKLFKLREAVVAYERFLAAAPVPAKLKDKVEPTQKRVAEIKGMSGKVHLESGPPNATILVDGKPSPEKTPTDIDLPSGKHTIRIEAEGYESAEREVDVQYAAKQDLSIELEKKAAPPPPPPVVAEAPKPAPAPPPPPPPPPSKVPAYITGGIAIAALGVGTGFGIAALSKSSDFKTNPTTDTADAGENAALVADMCLGVAITFGVTSAVLFLTKDPPKQASAGPAKVARKPAAPRVSIVPTPYITPQGGGAGALVRF